MLKKSKKDEFGDRMKEYENVFDYKITKKLPIIIRLDGRGFSKLTKKLCKPNYDFLELMAKATKDVASDIEGCVLGYTQSDEVTLLIKNDQSLISTPWFGNRIQKMVSIAAAEMTYAFNKRLMEDEHKFVNVVGKAVFDARAFTVPNVDEIVNVILWRVKDCEKNAISMVVYDLLSKEYGRGMARKMLDKKNKRERLTLLKDEFNIDFYEKYPTMFTRGMAVYRLNDKEKKPWGIDYDMPDILKNRNFISDKYLTEENETEAS